MTDKELIELLAGGAVIELSHNDEWFVVTRHGATDSSQVSRLSDEGWLDGFANGGGARLSEQGRIAYIRSQDEMGDGTLTIIAADKE